MNKKMKLSLIVATALILLGGIIFTSAMAAHGWDFTKLTTVKYESNSYVFDESVENVSVISNTADIVISKSSDGKIKVETYLIEDDNHTVEIVDGTLTIKRKGGFRWMAFMGINFKQPRITVYLPEEAYASLNIESDTSDVKISSGITFKDVLVKVSTGDVKCYASANGELKIKATTGNVRLDDITAGSINITTSTGNIKLSKVLCIGDLKAKMSTGDAVFTSVNCKNLTINGDTGDVVLKSVIASEKYSIKTDTGDVRLDSCDAEEIYIKTDTGDVKGTLLSEKIFIARTDTGDIDVPKTTKGGKCEITTDTGDIKIKIK